MKITDKNWSACKVLTCPQWQHHFTMQHMYSIYYNLFWGNRVTIVIMLVSMQRSPFSKSRQKLIRQPTHFYLKTNRIISVTNKTLVSNWEYLRISLDLVKCCYDFDLFRYYGKPMVQILNTFTRTPHIYANDSYIYANAVQSPWL